jgi:hypothetical protein
VPIAIPIAVPIADKARIIVRRSRVVRIYGDHGRGHYRDARNRDGDANHGCRFSVCAVGERCHGKCGAKNERG